MSGARRRAAETFLLRRRCNNNLNHKGHHAAIARATRHATWLQWRIPGRSCASYPPPRPCPRPPRPSRLRARVHALAADLRPPWPSARAALARLTSGGSPAKPKPKPKPKARKGHARDAGPIDLCAMDWHATMLARAAEHAYHAMLHAVVLRGPERHEQLQAAVRLPVPCDAVRDELVQDRADGDPVGVAKPAGAMARQQKVTRRVMSHHTART